MSYLQKENTEQNMSDRYLEKERKVKNKRLKSWATAGNLYVRPNRWFSISSFDRRESEDRLY
jgi:hypothetical protein